MQKSSDSGNKKQSHCNELVENCRKGNVVGVKEQRKRDSS